MRLNIDTRQFHADVDGAWLDLLRPSVSKADYLNQLVRTYGVVAPFEAACMYTPGLGQVIDLKLLSRAGLIAQDLMALGISAAQVATIPQCIDITTFRSVSEALGWVYVIERATLLQDGLRRHLLTHLPEVTDAVSYLSTYEGITRESWVTLGHALDRANFGMGATEIADAAHVGFGHVRDWFRNRPA